jgi:hypothetical protein
LVGKNDMRPITGILIVALSVAMARGEETVSTTPAGVVSNFIREVSVLSTNHAELAGFQDYARRFEAQSAVEFRKNIMPFLTANNRSIAPVFAKRSIRPSDCGTNGIFLQFILKSGTKEREMRDAPIDTVTYLPNLKNILYADIVLWEQASPELKKKLEDIIGKNRAMLLELDKKAASQVPEDRLEISPILSADVGQESQE